MKRRDITPEEREAFQRAFTEARPHQRPAEMAQTQRAKARTPPDTAFDERTSERLRRGHSDPEARLDLHGMTEANAHRALKSFLVSAQASRLRVVLVVTGRGAEDSDAGFDLGLDGARRGVLHRLVPRWLREPDFHGLVSAYRVAHRPHGGSGALYVHIRSTRS